MTPPPQARSTARHVRPRLPGASVFFTVTLADRRSDLLTREVARLREAVRRTRAGRPFAIDAFVVLPDHLHVVWTLAEGGEARPDDLPAEDRQRRTGVARDGETHRR